MAAILAAIAVKYIVQSAPKNFPNLKRYNFLIFFSKDEIKILQESLFTLQSRLVFSPLLNILCAMAPFL